MTAYLLSALVGAIAVLATGGFLLCAITLGLRLDAWNARRLARARHYRLVHRIETRGSRIWE